MHTPLYDYLIREKLSVAAFARRIGEGPERVRHWVFGRRMPRGDGLRKIEVGTAGEVTASAMINAIAASSGPVDAVAPERLEVRGSL